MRQIFSAVLSFALLTGTFSVPVQAGQSRGQKKDYDTATPIKHLVVIFDENNSFDHYFGTYPDAANQNGSPFRAKAGTPKVNNLTKALRTDNPNSYNPERLSPSEALTCDQDH